MIYTVTFNPALDYVIKVDNFALGQVNRTKREDIYYGGKGLNVSTVLKNLGYESIALGFIAGFTGEAIEKGAETLGFSSDFIKVKNGLSRINVKLKSNEETEINGQGPKIEKEDINELFKKLEKLTEKDILILSGSIPNTLNEEIYEKIMETLQEKNIRIVVDATKNLLLNVLKYKPFLIKPNNHELGEMFNVLLKDDDDIIYYAKKLQEKGARNVLISMAGDGAILITEDKQILKSKVPKGEVKNSVGAGDSMVAGFIAGYLENNNYEKALKMGIATGSASAFSEELATKEKVISLLNLL
ncbi:1-phosphofructokinase [Clostridium beijerinckii]|uniref:1-phosphofructokinase n=1 Tax=Clostridium beijerinckii TaxID=1520 RepID=UPI00098C765A|nr:1-phosphofructokinase [Clostridium beijerinckii]NRT78445.1 1-phosphofructokinase [Clostridium beijerinckii]OOM49888.1 tagatose-6-phosphate kinase [Clostridium beijerinckii]